MTNKIENPFAYSTDPELNRIFDSLLSLQVRVNERFAKADRMAGLGENPSFMKPIDVKINLPNYRGLREGGSSWLSKKTDLKIIDQQVRAAVQLAEEEVKLTEEKNKPITEHNKKICQMVTEMMTRLGIPASYSTYEYPTSRSKTKKSVGHTAGYIGDLNRAVVASNASTVAYQIRSYVSEYERWFKAEQEAEMKEAQERDERIVKEKILGNPHLVQTLMRANVNILEEANKALPGKKAAVIDYCISLAISNVKGQPTVDEDLLNALEEL